MYRFAVFLLLLSTTASAQSRPPNHLLGAKSPYLLQHLYNPVDWYPWGPEALEKAKKEGKMIFVSVGYASCHWCHVMKDESFENAEIAAYLNQHFVSIKIDRERRPDLDEQFMLVTQIINGSGGWPNTVLLTPDAAPFHGGTYYPPDVFSSILIRAVQYWDEEPDTLREQGENLVSTVSSYLTQQQAAADMTPEFADDTARSLLDSLDEFNGGIGVAPKFPSEPRFLFLLGQAERRGDRTLLAGATGLLDGMIMGGIHDQVGGGFHRYSVDPQWHVPHFEKMLYTQALTGRLLLRAWSITGEPRYQRAANRLFEYVLRDMRAPNGGFYSAQDADSLSVDGEKREGAFFTWTPGDLVDLGLSGADLALVRDYFQITDDGDFGGDFGGDLRGENVLNLSALSSETAASLGLGEAAFYDKLDPLLDALLSARAQRSPPLTDQKILASWNAVMIATLAEASYVLDRPDLYSAAETAMQFILREMKSGPDLSRVYFDGNAAIPALLTDYAALGLALIALHDYAPSGSTADFLAQARDIANTIDVNFGAAETGYFLSRNFDGFTAQIPTNDAEVPSGNAMALRLLVRLADRMPAPELDLRAVTLLAGISGSAQASPQHRATIIAAANELQSGGLGPVRFVASGAVKITFDHDKKARNLTATITIKDGWHINAQQPLQDYLIPTSLRITGAQPDIAIYPEPITKSLDFSTAPLSLYEGTIVIETKVNTSKNAPGVATLNIQACNDEVCLEPEDVRFTLWPM